MNTPNNAAALECALDEMGAFIEQEESPNLDTLENWHQRLRATLTQPDALTSQPSGGGEPIGYVDRKDLARLHTYRATIWPGTNEIDAVPVYTPPSADAPGVAVDEWRPIESAPKDGSCCIVTNDVAVGEAWYSADDEGWWWANTYPTDAYDGLVYEPTRWQPLPAPPAALAPKPEGGSHG